MTAENRIESYLSTRASQVELPHADLERVTARARTRRNRRRVARGGIAAAVLLGGIAFVAVQPDDGESVTNMANAVVTPSDLEWNVVPTDAGLGWSQPIVAEDGTVYALSTAANPGPGETSAPGRVLYRSADGGEWEAMTSPEGIATSSIATGDGALYALGTTAAGGGVGPVDLAVTTDGGETWEATEIPFDAAGEHPDFPGRIVVVGTEVAVTGGRTVVGVQVQGIVEVGELLGPDDDPERWYAFDGGLVRAPMCPTTFGDGDVPTSTTQPGTIPAAEAELEAEIGATPDPAIDAEGRSCEPDDVAGAHRSWEELGVDPSVGALVTGYTVVLAGPTDGELTRVDDLSGASYRMAQSGSLIAADDGFWFVGQPIVDGAVADGLTAWHSIDGSNWTASALPGGEPGGVLPAGGGTVDGRAVALAWGSGSPRLHVLGRGAATVDVAQLLDLDPEALYLYGWAFGPMGVALVVQEGGGPMRVVTSPDGVSFSIQEVPLGEMSEPGQKATVNGVTVTADAIKVRVNVRSADDVTGGAPLAQVLYVGTPA